MTILLFLLSSIFLSLVQATFLPLNFLLLLVVWEGLTSEDFLLKSFLAGLVFDLISDSRLGISSLAFLLIGLLSHLYSRKFSRFHFLFLLGILLLSFLIFNFLTRGKSLEKLDLLLLLLFIAFSFLRKWSRSRDFEIKLRV